MNNFNIGSLTKEQKNTRQRILEISFQRDLSHLGSCLSSVDLIDAVYKIKKRNEKFILSNGHAGMALYVVLEKNGLISHSQIKNFYIHPDRNPELGIDVSTGSLGQGLPIALGMAISDRNKNVYCLISDGESAEGSIWEALRIACDKETTNLKILVNANGWSAYDAVDPKSLMSKLKGFGIHVLEINGHDMKSILEALKFNNKKSPTIIFARTTVDQIPCLNGLDAHYCIMNDNDYREAINLLK